MVITIDGPAGSGKSTVARLVAERIGFDFLDTGAMYRAVGLAAIRADVSLEDAEGLADVAERSRIEFDWDRKPPEVMLNGLSVGGEIRTEDVSHAASVVAVVPAVRAVLVRQQQDIGRQRCNLVSEGRDQGTIVFPTAAMKFYLDASPAERARRRVEQLAGKGQVADYDQILSQIQQRDHRDSTRAVGPLAIAKDAQHIDTTSLSLEQVVELLVQRIESRLKA